MSSICTQSLITVRSVSYHPSYPTDFVFLKATTSKPEASLLTFHSARYPTPNSYKKVSKTTTQEKITEKTPDKQKEKKTPEKKPEKNPEKQEALEKKPPEKTPGKQKEKPQKKTSEKKPSEKKTPAKVPEKTPSPESASTTKALTSNKPAIVVRIVLTLVSSRVSPRIEALSIQELLTNIHKRDAVLNIIGYKVNLIHSSEQSGLPFWPRVRLCYWLSITMYNSIPSAKLGMELTNVFETQMRISGNFCKGGILGTVAVFTNF